MMPEMDGFDFLAEVRKQPQLKAIPVVVVTAAELSDDAPMGRGWLALPNPRAFAPRNGG